MSKPAAKRDVDPRDAAFGARVAELRKSAKLTQQQLASALNGRSTGWMSQVERGIQPVRRFDVLQEIADALGVSTQVLDPNVPVHPHRTPETAPASNDLDGARTVISGHPAMGVLLGSETRTSAPVSELGEQVQEVWSLAHQGRHSEISNLVVDLVPELERVVRTVPDEERQDAYRHLSLAYQALSAAFSRQGDASASWTAADRGMAAAEMSGDVYLVGASVFRMAHAFIRLGLREQAEHAVADAIEALENYDNRLGELPQEGYSVLGSLHLVKALIHARSSQRAEAREEIALARQVANRLGEDRNDYDLEFGPTNVAIQAVSTAVELGDAGEAVDLGHAIDADSLSPERRGRLLMDLGRANAQRRRTGDAVACLLRAEEITPEVVQNHEAVRKAVRELMLVEGSKASPELKGLAERTGAME